MVILDIHEIDFASDTNRMPDVVFKNPVLCPGFNVKGRKKMCVDGFVIVKQSVGERGGMNAVRKQNFLIPSIGIHDGSIPGFAVRTILIKNVVAD